MVRKSLYRLWLSAQGNNFKTQFEEIAKIKTPTDLQNFQENYLKTLLTHAYDNVPYYDETLKTDNDQQTIFQKLKKTPFLTKEIIRIQKGRLASKNYRAGKWYYNSSGGSSGEPVRFIQDSLFDKWRKATLAYYYEKIVGIDELGVKKVLLWGSERDLFSGSIGLRAKTTNWLSNTKLCNSFRMTPDDMKNHVKTINSYKPDLIRGYASSLYEICRFIEKNNLPIHKPKVVISAAERLETEVRQKIETVFSTKIFDFYGSREVNAIAGECKFGLMHAFTFNNYLEVLDENNQPTHENQMGRVVLTTLHNYSMPLIRYEVGDTAVGGPEVCDCGNPLPTLKRISGRSTDHFLKEDGTIVHGEYFTHLFYLKDWIKAFQVVQEDFKKIKVSIVTNDAINEFDKKEIENKIKLLMGNDCQVLWDFVKEIQKMPSGKILYTKSLIKN
jgi:phenylacetate-CoA ligase